MNNKTNVFNKIESLRVSLAGLLQNTNNYQVDRIVIPIMQRDYAQGRVNEQDVREGFLDSLYNYLTDKNKNSHDLDFIYGNINKENEFIPLDGQQRLTTLFLLHYYLSIHDNKYDSFKDLFVLDDTPRFVYQTRATSTDFCKALVNNPLNIEELDHISSTIKDKCPWFSTSWTYDPTVTSMLNMLDCIAIKFRETKDLFKRLIDEEHPAITFRVLFMKQNGLKDDLYIKMNSRGLELSSFENLKARIIQKLKPETKKDYLLKRTKEKDAEKVTPKDYFSFKMDIDWSNLFWIYKIKHERQTNEGNKYDSLDIDTPILNFISTIALNYKALSNEVEITNDEITNYDKLKWIFYSSLGTDFYLYLIKVFDLFYENACLDVNSSESGICDRLEDSKFNKFKIKETFRKFLRKEYKDAAYDEHIRLFAYYEYLIKHKDNFDRDDFSQWMRIVMNLTSNSSWQSVDDFCRAMKTIQWLINNSNGDILKLMADGYISYKKDGKTVNEVIKSQGFSPLQFHEERIKACLLSRTYDKVDWKDIIETTEKQGYFNGQILCLLNFSGIEEYFKNQRNCSWDDDEAEGFRNNFVKYRELLWNVFDDNGLKEELNKDQIFRRALLSYGNYSIPKGDIRYSFVINQSRDYSWKRYLQTENDEKSKERRNFFKTLLDTYLDNYQKGDFNEYLNACIKNNNPQFKDWCSLLIYEPRLWNDFGNDYFVCVDYDMTNVFILTAKTMGGNHFEIRTRFLFYKLKFEDNAYKKSQSRETHPYIEYKNQKNDILFKIEYKKDNWEITHQIQEEAEHDMEVREKLIQKGFSQNDNCLIIEIEDEKIEDFLNELNL